MPHYFASLDLDAYDVVISSSHACAVNARPREGSLYVCYCHTPMRYAWLPETDTGSEGALSRLGLRLLRPRLRRIDLAASRRPDAFAANSTAVRDRIRAFYGRDATVIHPPVDVADFDPGLEKEPGHFLWVHRLVPYKHPELVAEAFRDLPYRLTMVGVGPLERRLRSQPAAERRAARLGRARGARTALRAGYRVHPRRRGGLRDHDGGGARRRSACRGARRRRRQRHRPGRRRRSAGRGGRRPARAPRRDTFDRRFGLGSG